MTSTSRILNVFATEMADSSKVSSTGTNNATQTLSTAEGTAPLPTPNSPEPLYYMTGEARVVRRRRGNAGSSRANPYSNSSANATTNNHLPAYARRWDWLPTTLNTWRSQEAIRIHSNPAIISPYTQEPIHHTVPVLTARLHRHEERLEILERDHHIVENYLLRQTDDRIAQLFREQEDTTHTLDMVHQQAINDRGATDLLQAGMELNETRLQATEDLARSLEQRLEEAVRMIGRLTRTMERIVTLIPPPNPPQE